MSELDIGILALQGDVAENLMSTMEAMNELGIDGSVSQVKHLTRYLQLTV